MYNENIHVDLQDKSPFKPKQELRRSFYKFQQILNHHSQSQTPQPKNFKNSPKIDHNQEIDNSNYHSNQKLSKKNQTEIQKMDDTSSFYSDSNYTKSTRNLIPNSNFTKFMMKNKIVLVQNKQEKTVKDFFYKRMQYNDDFHEIQNNLKEIKQIIKRQTEDQPISIRKFNLQSYYDD